MTVTLDGYTLGVEDFDEDMNAVGVDYPAWENGAFLNKVKVYGSFRRWTLTCSETNVTWTNSAAKHLQTHLETGVPVAFAADEGDAHTVTSVNVYVKSLRVRYPKGFVTGSKYRRFTITVQET